ncbi:MAG: hypothetical protein CL849_03905, partial [Crocinitomicaceae bacterium]|nr:hypothetical protein [Crocinitomicaceae bacterium]
MLKQLLQASAAFFFILVLTAAANTLFGQCDEPMEFLPALSNETVQCLDDLPTECDGEQGASRGVVSCGMAEDIQSRIVCTATTAMGTGEDGAIVLFDVDGDPDDDRYFMPTTDGLSLTQFENGVAVVSGQVADINDPTAILNVSIFYDNGTSGADWDGGYKYDMSCAPTPEMTDAWTIYTMNSGLSFLVGAGSMEGTTLQLSHAPASEYFGFQVGEMANDRNCNYGAGGWFSYDGAINGVEIQGGTGDVLLDLECNEEQNNECGEDESSVTFFYAAYDADCFDVITGTETFTRHDTEAPAFDNAPADISVACEDMDIEVPEVTASDNCEDSDATGPTVTYNGQSPQYDITCTGSYKVDRTWTAEDCSGNQVGHTQTITVYDNTPPVISVGAQSYTAECDGNLNQEEFFAWLINNGGAMASDNCGDVVWSNDFVVTDEGEIIGAVQGCSAFTGSILVTFTATDDCGNASETSATFTIEDTTAPNLTVTPTHDIACEEYSSEGIYGASSSDVCGESEVVLVSVSEVSSNCAGVYLHTYMAVDECENESETYEQVVTLIDTDAPAVTIWYCPVDANRSTDENCEADTTPEANGIALASAEDNCDDNPEVIVEYSDVVTPGCTGSYTIERTWTATATDHCDNAASTSCTQIITVTDDTDPVPSISCPAAYTVDADELCEADTTPAAAGSATATATDNCSPADNISLDITYEDSEAIFECDGEYSFVRTWTVVATDDCGNDASTSCTQTITVEDNTAPTWDAYDTYAYAACEDLLDPTDPTLVPISASDNCSEVSYSIEAFQLSGGCPGTWMRVWTATDDCGNVSAETEQYVQLYDNIKPVPVIVCPEDYTIDADGACEADITPAAAGEATATATDNCAAEEDITIAITYEDGPITDVCTGAYYFTRTWTATATDECDNVDSISCDQLITVEDNTAPVITGGADETVECDGLGNLDELNAWLVNNGGATATDNCSDITWSYGMELSSNVMAWHPHHIANGYDHNFLGVPASWAAYLPADGMFTVTLTHNGATEEFQISGWTGANDGVIYLYAVANPELDYQFDIFGDAFGEPVTIDDTVSISIDEVELSDDCGATGSVDVVFTATDDCGNSSSTSEFTFEIEDTTAPVISGNMEESVSCDDWTCDADALEAMGLFSVAEDCGDYHLNITCSAFSGACVTPVPGYSITVTATDECDNVSEVFMQMIDLYDDVNPVASITCPADFVTTADEDCNADTTPEAAGIAEASATDNCDASPEVTISHEDGESNYTCSGSYSFTRTWTATAEDHCGNVHSVSCDQLITVNDETAPDAPVIDSPEDAIVFLDENCTVDSSPAVTGVATATAEDNCDSNPAVTVEHTDGVFEYFCEIDPGLDYSNEETSLNLLVTSGGMVSFNWSYHTDDVDPSYDPAYYINEAQYLLTDDDGPNDQSGSISFEVSEGDMIGFGINATDMCCGGAILTVSGFQAPGGEDFTGDYAPENWNSFDGANGSIEFSDDASTLVVTGSDDSGEGSYGFERVWMAYAEDDCGNQSDTSYAYQWIEVLDTIAPSFDGSSEVVNVPCDEYNDDHMYSVVASDNCDSDVSIAILSNSQVSGACAGTILRTYLAMDDCGNETEWQQFINLTDDVDPVVTITCPENTDLTSDAACNADTTPDANGTASWTATDNCDTDLDTDLSYSDAIEYGCEGSYTITRTWTITATDHCNNVGSTSCNQTITVTDDTDPTISAEAMDYTAECDGNLNQEEFFTWLTANGGATASDNCSDVVWSNDFVVTDDGEIIGAVQGCSAFTGSILVTFTATDACGNFSETSATFTIEDTTSPAASADAVTEVACDEYDPAVAYGNFTAVDACSEVTVEIADLAVSGACAGSYSRTYTITDECGNDTLVYQIINLTDDVAPSFDITCPDNVDLVADADCNADTSVETHGSATFSNVMDNCDDEVDMEVSSSDEIAYGCQGSYTISRTWTITGTDHCDNTTEKTCVQTITVSDETAPTISGGANALVECDGSGNTDDLNAWLANNGGATATDNCSAVSWSHSDASLSNGCGATGTVDVVFTATDECNNSATITLTFTIQDTTPPSLSIEGPANQNLDQNATCDVDTSVDALGNVIASAGDACGSASIAITHEDGMATYTCTGDDEALEGSYTFVRTFTVTATDECGLTTTNTYDQTITVTDGTAPQFTETCDLANGDIVEVCCEDLSGTVTIPDACETEAADNCDSDVAIAYTETYMGDYAPTDAVMSFCLSTTPAAYADGEACNGLDPHAFSLFNFDGQPRVDFVSVGSGLVSQMNDGTWMLEQELTNDAGTGLLTLTVTYGAASSWDDWFVAGQTNYKRDCGVLVDDHENWDYRILESGSVTGSGDYDGLNLSLSHAPANEYYAFQIGLGANNQNDNYGYSGWIMATGTYGDDAVFFSGDLFGDLDCCLPWSIDREYTASDDCGNATEFEYSISVNGDNCGDDDGVLVSGGQDEDHTPGIIGGAGDVLTGKSPIRVTNLQPNPTNDLSLLGFTVTQNMRLRVDMYTMDGILVSELYDG